MDPSHTDDEYMRALVVGDDSAFLQLYDRYGHAVYALALYILRDESTAEEVTQEVFLTLWQKASHFDPARGALKTWLLRLTRNRAIDLLRQRRHHFQLEAVEEGVTSVQPVMDELVHELNHWLRQLPEAQCQVLELIYFEGYTQEEVATLLQLPSGTIKTRIRLGLRKLRGLMK